MSECGPNCNCEEAQKARAEKDPVAKALGATRSVKLGKGLSFLDHLMLTNKNALAEYEKRRDNCKSEKKDA